MKKHTILASLIMVSVGATCSAINPAYEDTTLPGDMSMSIPDLAGVTTGCMTSSTYSATQIPAAMMVVLDRSASMADLVNGTDKWTTAAQAIVQSIDKDVFDSMSLGLFVSPSPGTITGPACIGGYPVACGNPAFAQVTVMPAGTQKSTAASGVRQRIRSTLASFSPDSAQGDASPLFVAVQRSLSELQMTAPTGKRILMVVTDGTISCNQFSSPARPGYPDGNGCTRDWEDPTNIVNLLSTANLDQTTPVESFVVGVPGADSYDKNGITAPPYHMRLALSAMAYAGSPKNVPAGCTGTTFTKAGGDPTLSCHFDLTQQAFSATAIANAMAVVRGKVAACTYDLPSPAGVTIDRSQVNVNLTTDGTSVPLFRRQDASNPCTGTGTGCWDYTTDGKVQLIGNACSAAQAAAHIDVKVTVGCYTIVG